MNLKHDTKMQDYDLFIQYLRMLGIGFYQDCKNFIINGSLDIADVDFCNLPDNLVINGCLNIRHRGLNKLPENLKVVGYLDIEESDIDNVPENLIIGTTFYLKHGNISSIPKNLKQISCITIDGDYCHHVAIKQNSIIIGCKEKAIDEWRYFFNHKQFYISHPASPNYKKIEAGFKEALRVHNLYF